MMKRFTPYLSLALGLVPAALCWVELLYRVHLHIRYGSRPFLNHVSDGYFGMMYPAGTCAIAISAFGLIVEIRSKATPQVTCYTLSLAFSITFMALLFVMHQQNMLVTYSEFVQNMGP